MATKKPLKKESENVLQFAFDKQNYMLMVTGLALLLVGFLLLIGGGSEDPNEFSYALFDFQRLTLAPILILAGYIVEIFAIMKRPKTGA